MDRIAKINVKIKTIAGKVGAFIRNEEFLIGITVFLLVSLAFGAGWLAGAKTYKRPPIAVNCPAGLYENR